MKSPLKLLNESVNLVTHRQMMPVYYRLVGKLNPLPIMIPDKKQKGVVVSFDVEN